MVPDEKASFDASESSIVGNALYPPAENFMPTVELESALLRQK